MRTPSLCETAEPMLPLIALLYKSNQAFGPVTVISLGIILATKPFSFPIPAVEDTYFLPQLFTRAGGRGEELLLDPPTLGRLVL